MSRCSCPACEACERFEYIAKVVFACLCLGALFLIVLALTSCAPKRPPHAVLPAAGSPNTCTVAAIDVQNRVSKLSCVMPDGTVAVFTR